MLLPVTEVTEVTTRGSTVGNRGNGTTVNRRITIGLGVTVTGVCHIGKSYTSGGNRG